MENLSVIDADSITFIMAMRNSDSSHSQMMGQVSQYVENILSLTQATHYLGFLGGEGNFRKQVAVTKKYKGNRGPKPESVQYWAPQIEKFLVDHWGFVQCHGIEADDACSISYETHKNWGGKITVCGMDHDLHQIGGHFYNYGKGTHHFFQHPQNHLNFFTQMLTGCTGDCVPGLPKYGPVKAEKVLAGLTNQFQMEEAVKKEYQVKIGFDTWEEYYQEQYTLLKLLEDGTPYGFTCPSPIPVPTSQPVVEEDISHLFA